VPAPAADEKLPSAESVPSIHKLQLDDQTFTSKAELMRTLGKSIPAESERSNVIHRVHAAGHYGVRTVVETIYNTNNMWWPGMREDVQKALQTCTVCQKYDVVKHGYHPLKSPQAILPNDWWQVDLVVMPTSLNQYSYILVVIDLFTSFVLTRPLKTKSAQETALELLKIVGDFGPPKIIQSDAGSEFCNSIVEELCSLTGTELRISTPYYKHSTGSVERVNRTLSSSLRKMLEGAIATWDTVLPIVTNYYNNTVRSLTKSSPYALMFARASNSLEGGEETTVHDMNLDDWVNDNSFESWLPEHHLRLEEQLKSHKRVLADIYPAVQQIAQEKKQKTAKRFNDTHKIVPPLAVGAKVWVLDNRKSSKHDQTWVGPYTVQSVNRTGSYMLIDELGDVIKRARAQLKIVHEEAQISDQKSFRVDSIIKHRGRGKNAQYLVKWSGQPNSQNSWVKTADFDDLSLIRSYWERKAPKRATAPRKKRSNSKYPSDSYSA